MNIHPIFVHFPIALLTIYAILEILPIKKLQNSATAENIKSFLVVFGALSSILAYWTGGLAGEGIENGTLRHLIGVHSFFAGITVVIFIVIASLYSVRFISRAPIGARLMNSKIAPLWRLKLKVARMLDRRSILVSLAAVGLIALTITGGLGGAIVYGPDADPIVKLVYKIFVGN